ncbi:MAG: aldehyde:ferredoxin oxidoreductase [Herpetosiphonaceae bacterium]|nr:aldehyde:ferredoxin oxidoreductase [Herpetosiphonaceae bacterium]
MAFTGRALRINLDTATTTTFEIPALIRELYLGGRGLTSGLFYHLVPPDTPARSPDNPLLIAPGLLAGTPAYATGGFVVTTRSPLTGRLAHSWAVGDWGGALKRAGYDVLWIVGQATAWLYLVIDNGQAELYPANHLNGLDTIASTEHLLAEHGADFRVLTLGVAGEKVLPYASMVAEGRYMAEPGGTGAVMAHKKLKAIVVRGTRMVKPAQPAPFQKALKPITERISTDRLAHDIRTYGSSYYLDQVGAAGGLTGHNGQDTEMPLPLSRDIFAAFAPLVDHGCPRCPLPCYHDYILEDGTSLVRPEVEALAGFGARCGLKSVEAIIEANQRCLRYGLDPTATANAIAFLMECRQKEMTRQYDLTWGDEAAVLAAIDAIATKEGIGGVLSLGVAEMSEIFYGSQQFAPTVNGLAMTPLDPRSAQGWALHLASSTIGGDARAAMPWYEWLEILPQWLQSPQSHAPATVEGKADHLIWHERFVAGLDAAGMCRRLGSLAYQVTPKELAGLLSADLGQVITPAELAKLGERIVTVERLLAQQWYHTDGLPARWASQALESGSAAGQLPDLAALIQRYYARHVWDADGTPTAARLAELSIPDPASRPWAK